MQRKRCRLAGIFKSTKAACAISGEDFADPFPVETHSIFDQYNLSVLTWTGFLWVLGTLQPDCMGTELFSASLSVKDLEKNFADKVMIMGKSYPFWSFCQGRETCWELAELPSCSEKCSPGRAVKVHWDGPRNCLQNSEHWPVLPFSLPVCTLGASE